MTHFKAHMLFFDLQENNGLKYGYTQQLPLDLANLPAAPQKVGGTAEDTF